MTAAVVFAAFAVWVVVVAALRIRALDSENALLREALARHERWCGHNPDAPGDSIVNEPDVAAALGENLREENQ